MPFFSVVREVDSSDSYAVRTIENMRLKVKLDIDLTPGRVPSRHAAAMPDRQAGTCPDI